MSTTKNIPVYAVLVVLSSLSFILNGTFLIVISINWTLVRRRRITYHVTNLAFSDFQVGACTFCGYVAAVVAGQKTTLTLVFGKAAWVAVLTSLLAVCLMAIERSLCIKKPLTWNEILALKRILRIMVGNWVLALLLAILMHFYTVEMKITFLILCYIPVFATSLVYINMYMRISKSGEADNETQQSFSIGERLNKLMQQKVGNVVLILTLVLVITMTPIVMFGAVKATCELLDCKFLETINTLVMYSYLLSTMNFVVNPILYAWRIRLYRQAFWKMLGRLAMVTNN